MTKQPLVEWYPIYTPPAKCAEAARKKINAVIAEHIQKYGKISNPFNLSDSIHNSLFGDNGILNGGFHG